MYEDCSGNWNDLSVQIFFAEIYIINIVLCFGLPASYVLCYHLGMRLYYFTKFYSGVAKEITTCNFFFELLGCLGTFICQVWYHANCGHIQVPSVNFYV